MEQHRTAIPATAASSSISEAPSVPPPDDNEILPFLPTLICSFCSTVFASPVYSISRKQAQDLITNYTKHMLNCGLKKVEERNWDISHILLRDLTISEIVFASDDEESDEDYIESDSDDEMEDSDAECLEERLENDHAPEIIIEQTTNDHDYIMLKFKFMSGLSLEGKFKSSDSIHLVTSWISIKAGMPKESISLRVNNQMLDNSLTTTLDELKIKSGSLINCYCRI